jgi:hypothetical protein
MDRQKRSSHRINKKFGSFAELGGEAVVDCQGQWGSLLERSKRIPSTRVKRQIVERWMKIICAKIAEELPERHHTSALIAVLKGALIRDLDTYEIGIERPSRSLDETRGVN